MSSMLVWACSFKEVQTGVVEVPEEDPEIFGSVVDFIYKGSFGPAQKCLSLVELREYRAERDPVYKTLFKEHNAAYDAAPQGTSYFSVYAPGFKAMEFQMFCMLWDRLEKYPKIWKVADLLQMPALKNLAMTRLYEDFGWKENDWRMSFVLACYDKPYDSAPLMFLSDIYGLGFRHIRKFG